MCVGRAAVGCKRPEKLLLIPRGGMESPWSRADPAETRRVDEGGRGIGNGSRRRVHYPSLLLLLLLLWL